MAICRECGNEFDAKRHDAAFDTPQCRKAWHNRRMVRGAELYDLFMAMRYERDTAQQRDVFTVLSNLARAYRDADKASRDGRHSWDLADAMQRIPLAFGTDGDGR